MQQMYASFEDAQAISNSFVITLAIPTIIVIEVYVVCSSHFSVLQSTKLDKGYTMHSQNS